MNIKCFVIHLERANERFSQVQKILSQSPIPSEIIYAVDGKKMDEKENSSYKKNIIPPFYPFDLRPSEVAAFHSHRKCWKKILDDKLDAGLIFEDDIEFRDLSLRDVIIFLSQHSGKNDYIRLPYRQNENVNKIIAEKGEMMLFTPQEVALGALAQFVTAGAAEQLLELTRWFDRPIDTYIQMKWHHGIRVLSLWPSCINEISKSLGGSTIQEKTPLTNKLKREIKRFIYRRTVTRLSKNNL